ncbi:MAG: TolC family protein, partial [Halanaerobiales bacterium]
MEKAEENMEKVKARKEIGDAGENQILSARLGLENASYSLEEIDNQIEDAEYTLYKNLALSRSNGFIIKESDSIVKELQQEAEEKINEYPIHDDDFTEQLMPLIIENNYDLIVNQIDREVLEQELEWLNKEDKADISFDSSYDTESEDLSFGINLSYPLYDGGQHEMDLKEQELAIEENLSSYDQLYQDLKQELKQFINSLQLSQKSVKRQELNLEHSQFELDAAEKQLEAGVIDYLDYQEYLISAAEAEFELKSLKNQLFIDRLELLNFIDRDNIAVLIGGF